MTVEEFLAIFNMKMSQREGKTHGNLTFKVKTGGRFWKSKLDASLNANEIIICS